MNINTPFSLLSLRKFQEFYELIARNGDEDQKYTFIINHSITAGYLTSLSIVFLIHEMSNITSFLNKAIVVECCIGFLLLP